MKRLSLVTILTIAALCYGVAVFAQQPLSRKSVKSFTASPVQSPGAELQAIDLQLKSVMATSLQSYAKGEQFQINPQQLIYGTAGDAMIAAAPVYGFEKLSTKDFDSGATVGTIFLSASLKANSLNGQGAGFSNGIPAGVYEIRVFGQPGKFGSKAQFIYKGQVVAEIPAYASDKQSQNNLERRFDMAGNLKAAVESDAYTSGSTRLVSYTSPAPALQATALCERRCYFIEVVRRRLANGCCSDWEVRGFCWPW